MSCATFNCYTYSVLMPSSSTSILAVTFSPASGYRLLITSSSSSWLSKLKAGTSIGREFTALCWLVYAQYVPVKLILYINILSYTCLCRAQPFLPRLLSSSFSASAAIVCAWGKATKKPALQSHLEVKALALPEVKIRKQCVLDARSVLSCLTSF